MSARETRVQPLILPAAVLEVSWAHWCLEADRMTFLLQDTQQGVCLPLSWTCASQFVRVQLACLSAFSLWVRFFWECVYCKDSQRPGCWLQTAGAGLDFTGCVVSYLGAFDYLSWSNIYNKTSVTLQKEPVSQVVVQSGLHHKGGALFQRNLALETKTESVFCGRECAWKQRWKLCHVTWNPWVIDMIPTLDLLLPLPRNEVNYCLAFRS